MTSKVAVTAFLGAGAYSASSALQAFVSPSQTQLPQQQQQQQQQQHQQVKNLRLQGTNGEESRSSSAALATGAFGIVAVSAAVGRKKTQRLSKVGKRATAVATNVDTDCINAIRFLAVDAINKSKSGHPGAPMGQAPIGYVLFAEEMNYNPADPDWINRDRFVLSSGHGSMLQYALLHLTGYSSVSMEDIKQFRQWVSRSLGTPLPELLDVFHRYTRVTCQVQQSILQHASMARGQDEAVPIDPVRICRIVVHFLRKQDISNRSLSHGSARVSTLGLVDGIHGKETDGVYAVCLHICCHSCCTVSDSHHLLSSFPTTCSSQCNNAKRTRGQCCRRRLRFFTWCPMRPQISHLLLLLLLLLVWRCTLARSNKCLQS